MVTVTIDRKRISKLFKATVSVISDIPFTAIEARATKKGSVFGRRTGNCLLSDDVTTSDGVVTFEAAVNNYDFDVEFSEILTEGEYRISVFILTEDGKWNDCSALMSSDDEMIFDKNSSVILVKRDSPGTDEKYTSAYSGEIINNFIAEVLL